ncbi:cytochrome c oxidase subunit 3, partial [Genlisea aurea]
PPKGIQRINPFRVPLLNTLILLSSGSVVTLFFTLVLGIYFLCIQFIEYVDASYTFIRRGYGRIFFLATGFHGFHVILGCILI